MPMHNESRNLSKFGRQVAYAGEAFACCAAHRELKLMRQWYRTLNDMFNTKHQRLLLTSTEHHRIGIVQIPGLTRDLRRPGLEHISFAYRHLGSCWPIINA